jgi:hypothetical protein
VGKPGSGYVTEGKERMSRKEQFGPHQHLHDDDRTAHNA